MQRALWLLLFLRLRGSLRRRLRTLRTVRGWLLSLVGLGFIVGWVLLASRQSPQGLTAWGSDATPRALARDVFPPLLMLACVMTVAMSSGPAIYFSRAEIDFLFTGPFSRRGLLLYKFLGYAIGAFISALCVTVVVPAATRSRVATLLGTFLTLVFLQLLSAVVGLFGQTLAARLHRGLRWALVGCGLAVLAGAVWPWLSGGAGGSLLVALRAIQDSALGHIVFAPFEPYARVLFAENGRDLAVWAVVAAGLDGLLLAGLLWLDAEYYEAVETVSQRMHQRWRQWHHGRMVVESAAAAGICLPRLPRWGGAGLLAWRQLSTAARTCRRNLLLLVLSAACVGPGLVVAVQRGLSPGSAMGVVLTIAIILVPRVLLFDFRGDLEHLDYLKSLPFRPTAVVLGQLLTPVLLSITVLTVLLGGAALAAPETGQRWLLGAALPMVVPFSGFHYAVENLIFLWFPWQVVPVGRMDFEFFGRTLLETLGKLTAWFGCGLGAAWLATVVDQAVGGSLVLALTSSWLFVLACGALVTWAAAWRFQRLDVAPRGRLD